MTTAPTPEEAERLAMVLRSACALSHPRFGTDARFVEMLASQAQAIEKELLRLQAENERLQGSLDAQRLISARAIALAKELEARKPLPLSDEQIDDLHGEANRGFDIGREEYFKAFRDAERAHGIKEP